MRKTKTARAALAACVLLALVPPARAGEAGSGPPVAAAEAQPALRPDQVAALARALDAATAEGFPQAAFAPPDDRLLAATDPALRAEAVSRLVAAALRYAEAQHGVAGAPLAGEWTIPAVPYDAAAAFREAVARDQLQSWLSGLAPAAEDYRRLTAALAVYRRIQAGGGWLGLPSMEGLKPGAADPRVSALRSRLAAEGYGLAPAADPLVFDPELAAALGLFQRRHGLPWTGTLDKRTLAALNTPVEARIAQILANLERWRRLPRDLPATRVEVNIAAAELSYLVDGRPALSMKVIVGTPKNRTPVLADRIESVVFNPPWNVPASIAAKELYPKARRDPRYFAREGFVTLDGGRLQQLPGPKNALGQIKFDLPNPMDVYLHDTPARTLFERDARWLSHGCVRLEKPKELARLVLAARGWDGQAVDAAVAGRVTRRVALAAPLPVYLLYRTVLPDGDEVVFLDDVYGWDRG